MSLKLVETESSLVDRALEISKRRHYLLLRLKAARVEQNVEEVYKLIDRLVPDSVELNNEARD